MLDEHLAHSANEYGKAELVCEHLSDVAARAADYAAAFDASAEAGLAGLLHDLGKYGYLFQARLKGEAHGVDHWSAGAWAVLTRYKNKAIAAAMAIQGHHLGLQQASKDAFAALNPYKLASAQPLGRRLSDPNVDSLLERLAADRLPLPDESTVPDSVFEGLQSPAVAGMLDVRMLFSALVDADFIETEAHFQPREDGSKGYREPGVSLDPARALQALMSYLDDVARQSAASPTIKRLRADLLKACLEAAAESPGLFTLTAPTGAGKTLSLLAFALKHAEKHQLRRIIVVIPYLTIIEQTVGEYKKAFQSLFPPEDLQRYVLEDHSLAGTRGDDAAGTLDQDMEDKNLRSRRLLAQNWDAPVVVTTSVQFLESLFANRPGACRKLHRLARSIILFDEVQTLPVSLAVPTLAAIARLAERYGSTVVFSTATQPAFPHLHESVRRYCAQGWQPREIVPPSLDLFHRARRTRVAWPSDLRQPTPWADLAQRIMEEPQALCVVNLKRHALALYRELHSEGSEGLCHLSTNMCPAHRQDVLASVRKSLLEGKPCRLVSTQCVEAGVDLDFPTVFRAWGPLDAVAQAAGRCNRNGKAEIGNVYVFLPEDEGYPDGAYRQAAGVTRILHQMVGQLDIHEPGVFARYYRELYDLVRPENKNEELINALERKDFADVAKLYRVISQDAVNVLVPYDNTRFQALAEEVRQNRLSGRWIVRARPYSVALFRPRADDPVGWRLEPVAVRGGAPSGEWFLYMDAKDYSAEIGLVPPEASQCLIA